MLALVVAKPGPVRDGLVALVGAIPDIRQIAQVEELGDADDFMEAVCPDITLIHATSISEELAELMQRLKEDCGSAPLVIVTNEEDRQSLADSWGDIVVIEGLPSAELATHIHSQIEQVDERTQKEELLIPDASDHSREEFEA